MTRYHHRQLGALTLIIGLVSIFLLAALLYFVEPHPVGIAVLILLVVCFSLFSTLTVDLTETDILVKFGPGLIVSGLGAVEIEMVDGGVHRIGTDEPAALLEAIRDACGLEAKK